jgi:hypothetical protein
MSKDKVQPPERQKRKPTPEQVHDFELAGGMEGGMPAGDAGGPGEAEVQKPAEEKKP